MQTRLNVQTGSAVPKFK
ncbi:hypothetical protein Tco_1553077, partial [Tanacetum coccineum]